MGYFKRPYSHLPAEFEENHEGDQVISVPGRIRNGNQKPYSSSRLARWWPGQAMTVP